MPYKIGGGDKLELFDPSNGQYTEDEKNKLFEEEYSNIVCRYVFNLDATYPPRFPIFGFHNDDYAELFLEHAISRKEKHIPESKITGYLLKYRLKDDKSKFFNSLGFFLENSDDLYYEILSNSDFSRMKFDHQDEFGLTGKVPTKIRDLKHGGYVLITTYWICREEGDAFHFTSVNINKKENEKWKK